MAEKGKTQETYKNPCLTMHQPWASLLVNGIKRIEGRSWPAPIRGRLWIHAASKVPERETIIAVEDFYREIYEVDGIKDIKFPEHYPTARLLGCVEVVGCVTREELEHWEAVPLGVRLEGQTEYCWLCEQPQRLLIPFEMRGHQGVYNLEKKIHQAAARGLVPAETSWPIKFPFPMAAGSSESLTRGECIEPEVLNVASTGDRIAANRVKEKFHISRKYSALDNNSSTSSSCGVSSRNKPSD